MQIFSHAPNYRYWGNFDDGRDVFDLTSKIDEYSCFKQRIIDGLIDISKVFREVIVK